MPTEIKFEEVSDKFAEQLRQLQAAHGNRALLKFPTRRDALNYMESAGIKGWGPYGLRRNGIEWFQIRPDEAASVAPVREGAAKPAVQRSARVAGAPTAKQLCLEIWKPGMEREAFVTAAIAAGVKDSTAKTMYSDIKAGRIK